MNDLDRNGSGAVVVTSDEFSGGHREDIQKHEAVPKMAPTEVHEFPKRKGARTFFQMVLGAG